MSIRTIFLAFFTFLFLACGVQSSDGTSRHNRSQGSLQASATPPITNASDALRTGWYPNQPKLDPSVVGSSAFGRRFDTVLPPDADGTKPQIFAQPLVVANKVFIVTDNNTAATLDAESGAIVQSRSLGAPWHAADIQCGDLAPNIGITGTPVIDASVSPPVAYFFSKGYRGAGRAREDAIWLAHAIDVETLAERPGFPVEIKGKAANDPAIAFDPFAEMQRPGLLLMNGVVYAAFGGHCDFEQYHGWIVGVSPAGAITTLFATEAGPNKKRGAGIWQSGGGLVSDGDNRIFFMTGNGYSNFLGDTPVPSGEPPPTLDEAIARVDVQADGSLKAADFFTPSNVRFLDDNDVDFGSGGPVALPPSFGTEQFPNLMVAVGKEGLVFLLDRDHMGGYRMGVGGGDDVITSVSADGGAWSRPSVWPGDGGWIYLTPNLSQFNAFQYGLDGAGKPSLSLVGRSKDDFGYTSGSPIVTSNGTQSGSALVWVTSSTGPDSCNQDNPENCPYGRGELRAYDAVPDIDGNMVLRFQDSIGLHAKFTVPGVGDGRIYVGTADGHVLGYGSPSTAPVAGPAVDFEKVVFDGSKTLDATVTANRALTVTQLSSSNSAFKIGDVSLPVSLAAGQSITVPVTFSPGRVGLFAGSLDVTTDAGLGGVPLKGVGQSATALLSALPKVVSFGGLALGDFKEIHITLSNRGAQALTFQSFTLPGDPYTVSGLPQVRDTLEPGASRIVSIRFAPTTRGEFDDQLVIGSDGGEGKIVLSGFGGDPAHMHVSTDTLDFGNVVVGRSSTLTFTVGNDGEAPLLISKSKPPSTHGFSADSTISEGTKIDGGVSLEQRVTFTPTAEGPVKDAWIITGNDGQGPQTVTVKGNGVSAR